MKMMTLKPGGSGVVNSQTALTLTQQQQHSLTVWHTIRLEQFRVVHTGHWLRFLSRRSTTGLSSTLWPPHSNNRPVFDDSSEISWNSIFPFNTGYLCYINWMRLKEIEQAILREHVAFMYNSSFILSGVFCKWRSKVQNKTKAGWP